MSRYIYDERREMARLFGLNMEARREEVGMSRKQLVAASGVSKSSIENYAAGRCEPCAWAVASIARALGCSADHLLGMWDEDD